MKMIAVVVLRQFIYSFCKCQIVYFGKPFYFGYKIGLQFIFCNAAYRRIVIVHADVLQLVQVTEHAYLRKLRHSGEEGKAQVAVGTFQYAIEGFQGFAVLFHQVVVSQGLQQGLVIFVHQHYYAAACLLAGAADDAGEASR